MRLRALVMGLVDPSGNPRPQRLINLLRACEFEVHVASFSFIRVMDVDEHYVIPRPSVKIMSRVWRKLVRLVHRFVPWQGLDVFFDGVQWGYRDLISPLKSQHFDVVFVEDIGLLPLAFHLFGGHKVIFDAREYYPSEFENRPLWNLIERPLRTRLCQYYLPKCQAVITVSPGLVKKYNDVFGIDPVLVRSVPEYGDYSVMAVNGNRIRMVYHGGASSDRKLENIIDIFALLDQRFELDLYLVGSQAYQNFLKDRASPYGERIRFVPPVPFDNIILMLSSYDIGLCYFEPVTFNLYHCLPNKLFEFIQARLAVLSGPSPDIADVLKLYRCGVSAKDFSVDAVAEALNALTTQDIMKMKEASESASHMLCYQKEGQKILSIIQEKIPDVMAA